MQAIRQRMGKIARLLVAAFLYALLLPPGAAPCIHHPSLPAHSQMSSAGGGEHSAPAGDPEHGGGHLGCSCCIGGICGGGCSGGCRLPVGCAGHGGGLQPARLDESWLAVHGRVVADTRVDLSAPLVRPQAPRAPPL